MFLRSASTADHPRLIALWERTPGIQLRRDDQFEPFAAYLARNPDLSLVLEAEGALIGSLLKSERVVMRPFAPPLWSDYGIATLREAPLSRPMLMFIAMLKERLVGDGVLTKPI